MKIIDLLNKIANGEKIKAMHKLFSLEYYNLREFHISYDKSINDFTLGNLIRILNDEVEILEEEKKIPEKLDHLIGYDIQQFDNLKEYVEITTNDLFGKVNKIIDTLNQVIDYFKSKGE